MLRAAATANNSSSGETGIPYLLLNMFPVHVIGVHAAQDEGMLTTSVEEACAHSANTIYECPKSDCVAARENLVNDDADASKPANAEVL
jgi:hypothetical protein